MTPVIISELIKSRSDAKIKSVKKSRSTGNFFSVMMTDGFTDVQETMLLCRNCS